jgi:uncharacterized RDD family membrane protein YckC
MIRHEVVTSEKVRLRYRVAGLGSRLSAWLLDLGLWAVLAAAGALMMVVLELGRSGLGQAVFLLWLFALRWGYFLLFEWLWRGQTPGKRLAGVRVVRLDGTGIGLIEAAVRNVVRLVDSLPIAYGLGFAVAAGNRERRRLGDLAAGTLVIQVERPPRPVRELLGEARADGATRQRLSRLDREQKQALLELCLRREQLRGAERARLFRTAAAFARQRLDLAPEAFESEEKFVLRLAAALAEEEGPPRGTGGSPVS